MPTPALRALLALAATRPEGEWPEQLDLATFHRTLGTVAPASAGITDVESARHVRDTVATVLLDGDDESSSRALDEVTETHLLVPTLRHGRLTFRPLHETPDGAVWAELVGELMLGVAEGARSQVKRCSSAPCTTPFFDSTSTRPQDFCCDRCATRARVRRHRSAAARA